jgi:hypothetical protein
VLNVKVRLMKADIQNPLNLNLAPRGQREILDQIQQDHELVERLKITPQEFEALSNCALFGTLTCKQDMLFILRQIREAGADHTTLVPQPAPPEQEQDLGRDFPRIPVDVAHVALQGPASLGGLVRRRVLFWMLVLVAGLVVWNGVIWMSRWYDNFMTTLGSLAVKAPPSGAWYSHLDGPNVLLWGEILVVAGVAIVTYRKAGRSAPRPKGGPSHSSR